MITRDRAVELVEAQLARQREESPAEWSFPELAVAGAQEHEVGWLLAVDSAEYLRTGDLRLRTTGWCGTYLVDRFDGSVHWLSRSRTRTTGRSATSARSRAAPASTRW
ncbi:hypothetical protein [Kitasatospora sp. NPDC051705]|uniref:hypothetical protein n=1 Tax=Kitasatospora sp. NPDC051705 TaxID=3364057 RepID=UPI0037BC0217